MFCSQCGVEIPGGAKFCPSCGTTTGTSPSPMPITVTPLPLPTPRLPQQTQYQAPTTSSTSGLAIGGFIFSFLCGIIGLILCISALSEIKNSKGQKTGEGLAVGGIVISILNMVIGAAMGLAS